MTLHMLDKPELIAELRRVREENTKLNAEIERLRRANAELAKGPAMPSKPGHYEC